VFEGDEPLVEATAALTRRMAAVARLQAGQRVLDVGCGTGGPARLLAQEHGVAVLGISTSEEGLAEARARGGEFELRDGMDNGLPDGSFDSVWVLESPHLMPRKDALIAECARVLRPGGRLVLCDVMLRRRLPLAEVLRRAKAFDLLRRVFGRAVMETLDFYAEQAEARGLRVDVRDDLSAATRPTFARWKENAARHREAVVRLVGETYADDFARSCDVLLGLWDEGVLGYGLLAAERPGTIPSGPRAT
jgi:27-O-demethylrifamycin SV methyltransferase